MLLILTWVQSKVSFFIVIKSALSKDDLSHDIISLVQRDAGLVKQEEKYKNVKQSLKTHLKKISKECVKVDKGGKGYFQKQEFADFLAKLRFPDLYVDEEIKKKLYLEFETPSQDFDYLRFIDYLKTYEREPVDKVNVLY